MSYILSTLITVCWVVNIYRLFKGQQKTTLGLILRLMGVFVPLISVVTAFLKDN